jgi:uncharacterized membrane protein
MRDDPVPYGLIGAASLVLVTLLVAGLTHFLAVLILPGLAPKDAYTLLRRVTPKTNDMVVLPPNAPGTAAVPFLDPATVEAVCFFDISKMPLRVRTHVDDGRLLTLSFRTPDGRIFYSMTDRAALRGTIDIRLVTPAQLQAIEDEDDEDAGLPAELRLKAPRRIGLIVATALVERDSERQAAEARLKAVTCTPEPLSPPQG